MLHNSSVMPCHVCAQFCALNLCIELDTAVCIMVAWCWWYTKVSATWNLIIEQVSLPFFRALDQILYVCSTTCWLGVAKYISLNT